MKVLLDKVGMEIPQIIKFQEQNIEFIETIVNKIREWLVYKKI